MVNIAELLKDCPKGMELDCTMFENVTLDNVDINGLYPIKITTKSGYLTYLTKYGQNIDNKDAKCVIFPKGKTTWEGFIPPCTFKDGDVLTYMYYNKPTIYIYRENGCCNTSYYAGYSFDNERFYKTPNGGLSGDRTDLRLATEEEKDALFKIIEHNGYRWDPETKTLVNLLKPKFKVGDYVAKKGGITVPVLITGVGNDAYYSNTGKSVGFFNIKDQDDWELVPNKFDVNTLVPFESRVLVRMDSGNLWKPAIFGCCLGGVYSPYYTLDGSSWKHCIPYEGNERLIGKADDCDDFYKNWNDND